MMRRTGWIVGFVCAVLLLGVSPGFAVEKQRRIEGEVVMQVGDTVHLFHSGTAELKKIFCVNDVLPVYNDYLAGGNVRSKKVGTVQILSYIGDNYLEAKVLEGEVERGDIARKENAACVIQPVGSRE